jgi:hypothetical protein
LGCYINSISFSINILVDINFKMLANYISSMVMGFIEAMELTSFEKFQLEDISIRAITTETVIDIKELDIKVSNMDLCLAIDTDINLARTVVV